MMNLHVLYETNKDLACDEGTYFSQKEGGNQNITEQKPDDVGFTPRCQGKSKVYSNLINITNNQGILLANAIYGNSYK